MTRLRPYTHPMRAASLVLVLLSWSWTAASAQHAPSTADAQVLLLAQLDADLTLLAEQARAQRIEGWLQIGGGTALGTVGGFLDDPLLRGLLLLTGSVGVARGLNDLLSLRGAVGAASAFQSAGGLAARLALGERRLCELARRSRTARWTDGTLTMASAAAYVPMYWGFSRRQDPTYRFGDDAVDYVGLTLSVVAFATGMVRALRRSTAERKLARYRQLKASTLSPASPQHPLDCDEAE